VICAAIASSKGRSVVGWFFVGFLIGIIGLIICLCMSNLKAEQAQQMAMESRQRRLREQLRQEQLKGEAFRLYSMQRLDSHDKALGVDTRSQPGSLPGGGPGGDLKMLAQAVDGDPGASPATDALNDMAGYDPTQWYYNAQDTVKGPVSTQKIKDLFTAGKISIKTLLWSEGMADWRAMEEVPQFTAKSNSPSWNQ
jgi:hypothetical protein